MSPLEYMESGVDGLGCLVERVHGIRFTPEEIKRWAT